MTDFLRFTRILALGSWSGAIIYFVAVVTRGAFAVLSSRDEAGLLIGFTLSGLHVIGLLAAAIFVLASLALRKSLRAFIEPAVLGVTLMAGFHRHSAISLDSANGRASSPDGLRRGDAVN